MKAFMQKLSLAALLLLVILQSFAQPLPRTTPEMVGFSSQRLQRIDTAVNDFIKNDIMPGAVVLVARQGKIVHLKAYGMRDREAKLPMTENTMFRIASMSKTITTAAALMLLEEGKFLLDDPLSMYIPAFAAPKVMVDHPSGEADSKLEEARSPILIRHLLNHTSGIAYGLFAKPQLSALYEDAGISDGISQTEGTLADWVEKIAKMPLSNHPGEAFEYGLNIDVLGRLIEIWSGMPLDQFLQKRIFQPLQMTDTHFFLTEQQASRLAAMYEPNSKGGLLRFPEETHKRGQGFISSSFPYKGPRTFFSGGGGLVSTAQDYARFAQMLVNGGTHNNIRLLSPRTVELMLSNQIGNFPYPWVPGHRFGFGGYVNENAAELESVGTFGWSGYFSTYYWIDPKEKIVALLLTQVVPELPRVENQFKNLIYQAIIK
ncbi:MAG: serine hydrolase domain-containing protein [Saprospiraceae bacterium]